jgi:hypothetical protein
MTINPMQGAHDAPRCQARSKRTRELCRAPAVRGCRVCRMHGARGGAPNGEQNGNYRHGTRTKEALQAVRYVNLLSWHVNPEQSAFLLMSAFARITERTCGHVRFVPLAKSSLTIRSAR